MSSLQSEIDIIRKENEGLLVRNTKLKDLVSNQENIIQEIHSMK